MSDGGMKKQEQGVLRQQPELEGPRGGGMARVPGGGGQGSSTYPRRCSRQRGEGEPPGFSLSPPSRLLLLSPSAEPNQGSREVSFPVIQDKVGGGQGSVRDTGPIL